MALLEMINGPHPGQRYTLSGERTILGRHPDCDIVLEVGAVSRQHAQISRIEQEFVVEDLHSRNGTFVNGEPIQTPTALQNGDRLRICDLSFTFFRDPAKQGNGSAPSVDTSMGMAMLVDDAETAQSTIMSKVDVSSSSAGSLLLSVNPEVKLRAFIEITHSLSKALSVDEVLPKVVDSLFKIFVQADRGFIVLKMPDGKLVPKVIRHRRHDAEDTVRISRTILNQVMTTKQAILSADAASDRRFEMSQSIADFRIRSMMCAPLVNSENEALGVIQIDALDRRSRFQQEDLDVLAGVASQAAFAIDNAQLHERALQQQKVQRDLELAHKVQQGLLPSSSPKITGYHFFDYYEPANQVGGDFYDYIALGEGKLAVVLADVSGKGVSAALVMAKLSGEVRYCLVSEPVPSRAVNRINALFSSSGWEDRFVTMVVAVVDPQRNQLTIVNAGHMPLIARVAAGKLTEVGGDRAGLPLGVDATHEYEQVTVDLEPGAVFVAFTDGISEAMNAANELYGFDRLRKQIGDCADSTRMGKCILEDVKQFVGGHPQSDDMCLVCFGRIS